MSKHVKNISAKAKDCLDSDRSNFVSDLLNLRVPQLAEQRGNIEGILNSGRKFNGDSGRNKLQGSTRTEQKTVDPLQSPRHRESNNAEADKSRHKSLKSIHTIVSERGENSHHLEPQTPKHNLTSSHTYYEAKQRPSSNQKDLSECRCSADDRMANRFSDRSEVQADTARLQKKEQFPFHFTPSGNLKVGPDQVIFNSKKVSILVAEPNKTKINIAKELEKSKLKGIMPPIPSKLFQAPQGILKMEEGHKNHPKTDVHDYETDFESIESLKPEMNLDRLGYSNSGFIDYSVLTLPTKTNLYQELHRRISNYLNTDVQVIIGQEEFSCHSMVLQSYSEFFEKNYGVKRLELPLNEVSVNSFVIIYDWMITGQDCIRLLKRDNIIDVFIASRFLGIKELEEQCWAFIDSEEVFSEDTAFLLYKEAKKRGIHAVRDLMIPRIRNFFLILVSSQDFVELDPEEIIVILSSNYIAVNCEMEVLMSAVRWLKYDWENRFQHLVKIMSCIRFGLIAPWQLVDIKRNPENPELLEIMTVPEISKMVDDGLSFVIIKYWYGHQSDDYSHWIELLGLTEPTERNWAGSEKSYVTYRQFLAFLDSYRRENLLEKTRMQTKKADDNVLPLEPCAPPPELLYIPSSNDSSNRNFEPPERHRQERGQFTARTIPTFSVNESTDPSVVMTEDSAATAIQSAYRNYRAKKQKSINDVPTNCGDTRKKEPVVNNYNQILNNPKIETSFLKPKHHKILSLFATSKDRGLKRETKSQQVIASPLKEKYMVEGSLFSFDRECVLVFGGIDPHSPYGMNRNTGNNIYRYLPEDNRWDYVGELPEPRHHHATAFYRGRVYLAGGANPSFSGDKDDCAVNTVWSFDPVQRSWYRENPLITARKNFGFVVADKRLYAIGGQDKTGKMLSSVERYESGGSWSEVAGLKTARMGVASAKYRDCIWVAGGMVGSRKYPLSNLVECYDCRRNEWDLIENLRIPRCCACLFTMNDKLYLIGGAGKISDNDRTTSSVGAIDIWDSKDKEWKLQTELLIPRHGHSVAYLGTQILIIGGVTTVYMRALSNTECYCCERNTWVRGLSPLPTTLSGHSSVTLPPASLM